MSALAPALALALALAAPAVPGAAAEAPASVQIERRLTLMGTELTVRVEAADRRRALAASERAVRALAATEARLSTWRDDTELARLNRAGVGEPFPLSPELAADLAAARRCWQETGGAFEPTVGALAEAWGLRRGGRAPSPAERSRALAATGMAALELLSEGTAVRGRPDLTIDEGGFGKGVGLAAALAALDGEGEILSASLDLGGQVALLGRGRSWRLAVADPRDRNRPVVMLTVDSGSIATTGNSERGIVVDGERRSHVLDPRTGLPAADFGSLTVWAEDPLRADCLSTGLYVLGPQKALALAEELAGVEALVLAVTPAGLTVAATSGLASRVTPLADDLESRIGVEARLPAGGRSAPETARATAPGQEAGCRPLESRAAPSRTDLMEEYTCLSHRAE